MIGQQEVSVSIMLIGILCFVLILMDRLVSDITKILVVVGMMFCIFAIGWLCYLISYNKLQPLINRIRPETDIVWVRITKGGMLTFQVAKKGVYGQTKGLVGKYNADVVDKGDFPIRCVNGNSAILVYDMMSHNVNPKNAVGWKQIFKRHKIDRGKDAYGIAKQNNEVIKTD